MYGKVRLILDEYSFMSAMMRWNGSNIVFTGHPTQQKSTTALSVGASTREVGEPVVTMQTSNHKVTHDPFQKISTCHIAISLDDNGCFVSPYVRQFVLMKVAILPMSRRLRFESNLAFACHVLKKYSSGFMQPSIKLTESF